MAMLTILLLLSAAIVLGEAFDLRAAKAGVVEEQQEAEAAESDRPCPGGWTKYKSRCFMFVNNAMTWPQAENKLWFWSDGSKFDYQSWGQGEPNNYGGNEHCLQMNAGGDKTWNDLNCEVKLPMVCALRTC